MNILPSFRLIFQIIIFLLVSVFYSCSNTIDVTDDLSINEVQHIVCKANSAWAIEVYVPSAAKLEKKLPVIYVIDAHARGRMAVNRLAVAAERYHFIVVASDNASNNNPNMQLIIASMLQEAEAQFNIDPTRRYLCGFSGGARVAGLYALKTNEFKGAILCAASADLGQKQNMPALFSVVGLNDLNFHEVLDFDLQADKLGLRHCLKVFAGAHEFPPAAVFEDALLWFNIQNNKDAKETKNAMSICQKRLQALIKKQFLDGDKLLSNQSTYYAVSFFNGTRFEKHFTEIVMDYNSDQEVQSDLSELQRQYELEQKLKIAYYNAMDSKSFDWWQNELKVIQHKTDTSNNNIKTAPYKRLLGFVSMMCFMKLSAAIKENDIISFNNFSQLYALCDTNNPDRFFLKSRFYAQQNLKDSLIINMNRAISMGFISLNDIESDTILYKLLSEDQIEIVTEANTDCK